jgi:hypothetical protein
MTLPGAPALTSETPAPAAKANWALAARVPKLIAAAAATICIQRNALIGTLPILAKTIEMLLRTLLLACRPSVGCSVDERCCMPWLLQFLPTE